MQGIFNYRIAAYGLFAVIVSVYLTMAAFFPVAYIVATYEDLIGEWAQWFFFLVALVFSVKLAYSSGHRLFFLGLALACFYVLLEEISWGQRIFGFVSPAFFRVHNLQHETNLHNFFTGPYSTLTKDLIEYSLALALVCYGLLYPLTLRWRWRIALRVDHWIPSPPLYLWPFFLTASVFELGLLHFNEAEIAELLIASALAIMTLHFHFHTGSQDRPALKRDRYLVLSIVTVSMGVLMMSAATSYALYRVPHLQAKTDQRIKNGIGKFAARYMRYRQWDMATQLYETLHHIDPERTSILRKLGKAYREMGERDRFEEVLGKAIAIDLRRYHRNPHDIQVNQSLARSYRLLGEHPKANEHLALALDTALERVKQNPESASAAYRLGKTYELLGQSMPAAKHFKLAYDLKPTSSKYMKAAFKTRKDLGPNSK